MKFEIMYVLAQAIIGLSFIIAVISLVSPKMRDKMFGKHIELTARRIKLGFADADNTKYSKFCPKCGKGIEGDSVFCKACGSKVE